MIFSYHAHLRAIQQELFLRPKKVWISSFGINSGVGVKGTVWTKSQTYDLLTSIDRFTTSSRILIGVPTHSTRSYVDKLTNNADVFRSIQWRYSLNNHLKVWIFFHKRRTTALFGGRNLGDSEWNDASIWLLKPDVKQLVERFDKYWSESPVVPVSTNFVLKSDGKVIK